MFRSLAITACAPLILAAATWSCSGGDPTNAKEQFLRDGDQLAAKRQYQAAIIKYKNAIQQDERFGRARFKLAEAYASLEDWPRARAEFVRAADLLPDNADAQVAAGLALLRFGEFQDAATRASLALKIDPTDTRAYLIRGSAAAGLRDLDGAMRSFEEGLAADPNRPELHLNIGAVRRLQGNDEEAEAAFKQAVAVSPQSISARLALANYYWATGRLRDAEVTIQDAVALEAGNITANRTLAAFYMATNRPKEAEAPLRKAADASPTLEPRLVLADYLVWQQRHADALPLLHSVPSDSEWFAAAMSRLAAIEYQLGRHKQAFAIVEQVLAREPGNVRVLVLKATWLAAGNELDGAARAARAALDADPESWVAHDLLGSIYVSRRRPEDALKAFNEALRLNPRALTTQIALADLHRSQGRTEASIGFAEGAVRAAPESAMARTTLVRSLLAHGEHARARTELQPLISGGRDAEAVQTLLGEIEVLQHNVTAARTAFARAAMLNPASAEAVAGLIRLDLRDKAYAQAVQRVQEFTKRAPANPRGFFLAAQTYANANDIPQAVSSARKAIELDADYLEAYALLGQLYIRERKLEAARQEFERLVERHPMDIGAHTMIGILLQIEQRHAEATKVYEKVLTLDPRAVVAANNLAYTYASAGHSLDVALSLAQTAKVGRPDDPDVNDTLGWIYYKRNLPTMAIEPLELSVRKNPGHATYQYHLGMAYLSSGDKIRGRAALQKALTLQHDFEGAAEARKALEQLRD